MWAAKAVSSKTNTDAPLLKAARVVVERIKKVASTTCPDIRIASKRLAVRWTTSGKPRRDGRSTPLTAYSQRRRLDVRLSVVVVVVVGKEGVTARITVEFCVAVRLMKLRNQIVPESHLRSAISLPYKRPRV